MTLFSYNGWVASTKPKAIGIVPLVVNGVSFAPGVRGGDVHDVMEHFWTQFDKRVERLKNPGCWGWSFRKNRNANNLSCHASGTASDGNAPQHPNGIEASRNFSTKQIAEIHKILAEIPELAEVLHWGGDWHAPNLRPDPMHVEIHNTDKAKLARVAARCREFQSGRGAPMNNVQHLRAAILDALDKYGDAIPASRKAARVWVAALRRLAQGGPKS